MSISLYYIGERERRLSLEEINRINSIIEKYRVKNNDYWEGGNISIPDYTEFKAPVVIEGSVEIGEYPDDYEMEIEEVVRWCYCLTEIAREVDNITWNVILGDEALIFDDTVGFKLKKIPVKLHLYLKPDID